MSAPPSEIDLDHEPTIQATRFPTELKTQFEMYLASKFPFLMQIESNLKFHFKNADEEDEANAFFELKTDILIKEIKEVILGVEAFSVAKDAARVGKIMNQILKVLYANIKNNEITLKALDNIHLVVNFFNSLRVKKDDAKEQLSIGEKSFDLTNTSQTIKVRLEAAEEVCTRMIKSVGKIKKTQITFTVDDETLSNIIQGAEGTEIDIQEIMQQYDSCTGFLERAQEEIDYLMGEDLLIQDDEVDGRLRNIANLFVKFFEDQNSHLVTFLAYCYLYREHVASSLTEESSQFATLLLKKSTSYKTFIFLKYFEDFLEAELDKNIKTMTHRIKTIFDSQAPLDEAGIITAQVAKTKTLVYFVKNALVGKRTDTFIFNNPFLNEKIPQLIAKVDKIDQQLSFLSAELRVVDVIAPNYDLYVEVTNQMKLINLKSSQVADKVAIQHALRRFYAENDKLELAIFDFKHTRSSVYRQIRDILDGNIIIAQEYKSLFTQINNRK